MERRRKQGGNSERRELGGRKQTGVKCKKKSLRKQGGFALPLPNLALPLPNLAFLYRQLIPASAQIPTAESPATRRAEAGAGGRHPPTFQQSPIQPSWGRKALPAPGCRAGQGGRSRGEAPGCDTRASVSFGGGKRWRDVAPIPVAAR